MAWLLNCLKSPASKHPWTVNLLKSPKHCWNLHDTRFMIFFRHSKRTSVGKSICLWYLKSYDFLLTHWHPMSRTLNLLQTIQMELSKKPKTISQILAAFLSFKLNFQYFIKIMTLMYFLIYRLRKTWLRKCLKNLVSPLGIQQVKGSQILLKSARQ